jgi:hypothetical protein
MLKIAITMKGYYGMNSFVNHIKILIGYLQTMKQIQFEFSQKFKPTFLSKILAIKIPLYEDLPKFGYKMRYESKQIR